MKIAELFKHMIDLLDQEEQAQSQSQETTSDELGTMVPPLQQKIEILKKSQGIDNVYDEQAAELNQVKKNAGLAVITTAEEDEPFEG
jgi:hypothetical protein